MTIPEPAPAPSPAPAAPPKAKRWKKVFLITGCVFGGLILFVLITGPFIIGAIAKSQIASTLEEKFQAKVSLGSVSFSWSGKIELNDFRMVPKNFSDPLVEVKKVDVSLSLGSAIGGSYIADVEVVAPRIIVEKGADGKFNYDFPPQPPKEAKKKPGGKDPDEQPFVQATVKVRDGQVRIRGRGRETVYQNLAVEAKVDTLDKPIAVAVSLDTVKMNGRFDLNTLSGPATLVLDRFSLKNVTGAARAYSGIVELDGTISGSLDYEIKGAPRFSGKGRLEAADFKLNEKIAFDRLTIVHEGSIDRHTVTIDAGKALAVRAQIDVADTVTADLTGSSDLGELGAMLERLIGMKPDMAIEGKGTINGRVEAKGADIAKAELGVSLSNVVAIDMKTKRRYEIDPLLELKFSGGWNGKTRTATAEEVKLTSSFATMDGKGGAALGGETPEIKESTFRLDADLEKLGAKLALFMEDAPGLRGTIGATASYAGDRYDLAATVSRVTIRTERKVQEGGREVIKTDTTGPLSATVSQKGILSLAKGGGFKIETGVVTSSAADLKLTGEIRKVMEESREGEIRIEAVVRPVELSKWVSNFTMAGPEIKATGVVSLKPGEITAAVKAPAFEWVDKGVALKGSFESQVTHTGKGIAGTTKISNLEVTDEKKNVVKDPGVTIVHDVGLADSNRMIDLRKVEVASSFLRGGITGTILRLDRAFEFRKVHLAFKYLPGKLGAIARPWLPGKLDGTEEKVLDITLEGKASSSKMLAVLRGTTGAIDLDLATFTMDGLSLSGKTHLDLKGGKLVSGTPLSVNKGKTDLHASLDFNAPDQKPQSTVTFNAKDVNANGQMGPLLERINPIFHTSGVDAKVDGRIQSDFKLLWSGPIDPDEKDWVAAASRLLSGSGLFSVQELNIAGSPAVGQIMQAIGQDNAMQGEVIATQIRIANGRCEYENMLMRGSRKDPAVLQRDQELLAADRQQLEAEKAQLSPREYQKRGEEFRQREEDLPFRYTLRFTGWVGFDKRMQLRVLMPMTQNMARSHPGLTKYIGTTFWVDLTGTTESPRLDVNKMLAEAVKRAAEGVLMDKLDDALKRLLDKKKKDEKN